jgi:antitoxin component HigA of HigAB toxin-antitoxin module
MRPRPIRNDRELELAIACLDDLDRRDRDLTPEERELAELYTTLIGAYEETHYPVPHAPRTSSCERFLSSADWLRRASPLYWVAAATRQRS